MRKFLKLVYIVYVGFSIRSEKILFSLLRIELAILNFTILKHHMLQLFVLDLGDFEKILCEVFFTQVKSHILSFIK
jgi:hypothetical protein